MTDSKILTTPTLKFFNTCYDIRTIYFSLEDLTVFANTNNESGTEPCKTVEYKLDMREDLVLSDVWEHITEEFVYHWQPKHNRVLAYNDKTACTGNTCSAVLPDIDDSDDEITNALVALADVPEVEVEPVAERTVYFTGNTPVTEREFLASQIGVYSGNFVLVGKLIELRQVIWEDIEFISKYATRRDAIQEWLGIDDERMTLLADISLEVGEFYDAHEGGTYSTL